MNFVHILQKTRKNKEKTAIFASNFEKRKRKPPFSYDLRNGKDISFCLNLCFRKSDFDDIIEFVLICLNMLARSNHAGNCARKELIEKSGNLCEV